MNKAVLFWVFLIALGFSPLASALPKAVIMLRHAEEPKGDETYLSKTGVERSRRLVKLFKNHPQIKKLGAPAALFAAGAKDDDSSVRSIQTLHFLSQAIKIPINDSFKRNDTKDLAEEILENNDYDDQVVVICWSHKFLKDIAKHLGMKQAPDYPSGQFDRLWILSFDKKDKKKDKIKFQDLPQKIMPGDDSK